MDEFVLINREKHSTQTSALNRLIGLMNAANGDLAHLIVIIRERAMHTIGGRNDGAG